MSRSSPHKFVLVILVLVLSCIGIILNGVALCTEYWVVFRGSYRLNNDTSSTSTTRFKDYDDEHQQQDVNFTRFTVDIHAGLFRGVLVKCCRPTKTDTFSLKEEYFWNKAFMNFGLWVSTLVFLALAITFGCFSAIMSGINAVITPIELITGLVGLYLWNGLACLFCAISLIIYGVQFFSHFAYIARGIGDHYHILGKMDNHAKLDYSFYLVVVAASLYLINNALVCAASRRFGAGHNQALDANHVSTNGIIMLY